MKLWRKLINVLAPSYARPERRHNTQPSPRKISDRTLTPHETNLLCLYGPCWICGGPKAARLTKRSGTLHYGGECLWNGDHPTEGSQGSTEQRTGVHRVSESTAIKCDLCGETAPKGTAGWARLGFTINTGDTRYAITGAYWQKQLDLCPVCLIPEPRFRVADRNGFARIDLEEDL